MNGVPTKGESPDGQNVFQNQQAHCQIGDGQYWTVMADKDKQTSEFLVCFVVVVYSHALDFRLFQDIDVSHLSEPR